MAVKEDVSEEVDDENSWINVQLREITGCSLRCVPGSSQESARHI